MRDATSLPLITLRFRLAQNLFELALGGEIHGLTEYTQYNGKFCLILQFLYWPNSYFVTIPELDKYSCKIQAAHLRIFSIRREGGVLLPSIVPPPIVASPKAPPMHKAVVRTAANRAHSQPNLEHASVCAWPCVCH